MNTINTHIVVLGSGPGGYSAAFRLADLGKKVVLIERYKNLGGVCLNVGCIPSKSLLHISKVIKEFQFLKKEGIIEYNDFVLNKNNMILYKNNIINKLNVGLQILAKQRNIAIIQGNAKFISNNHIEVKTLEGINNIVFDYIILAVGSRSKTISGIPQDDRIITSNSALDIKNIPEKMLIIGGGIIGLEMAQIYSEIGSDITIVESQKNIIKDLDEDIIQCYDQYFNNKYHIFLDTKINNIVPEKNNIVVHMNYNNHYSKKHFNSILLSVGRIPNTDIMNIENTGIILDKDGFIVVDQQLRTNIPHIFAIGDVVGSPMLAHKAMAQGRLAAEVISGYKHYFNPTCIPSVIYTDPEVAWVGLTEKEANKKGIKYSKGIFPWTASGRSLSMSRTEGLTKILFNEKKIIIGASIIGTNAGELISEASLAIEMGCNAEDISLTMHPHPTLSETFKMATEVFEGNVTDIFLRKKE